jgi:hypothetical protein
MPSISVPNTFSNGGTNTADANQINANFAAIVEGVNGLEIPTTPVTIANGGTSSTTVQEALTAFGLGAGTVVACTTSAGSGTPLPLTLTTASGAPTLSSLATGLLLEFTIGASALTGPFTIAYQPYGGSALAGVPLYDAAGQNQIGLLAAGQTCLVIYSAALGGFCLLNPPVQSQVARFAQFSSPGTYSFLDVTGVTQIYATICGGGGAGGNCEAAGDSGGGGGGAGQAYNHLVLNVSAGTTYTVVVGAGGTPGSGTASGGAGTASYIQSSGGTLVSCAGGGGGQTVGNASPSNGGTSGGAGGAAGQNGYYFTNATLSAGGAGGSGLLGSGGAPAIGAGNGQAPGGYGCGGGGGSASTGSGAAGGGGYCYLQW